MKKVYPAVITAEEGLYVLRVPDVPGCVTTAERIEDAVDMIRDALCGCLCVLEDKGRKVPEPSDPAGMKPEVGTVVLVDVDTMQYRKETDTRAVRKSVSIPAWMAYMAEQRGVNCSQVLQDALRKAFSAT